MSCLLPGGGVADSGRHGNHSQRPVDRHGAARLFVEQGYAATTLRQIAAAAGVGERTLYDAFPTKTALFGHTLSIAIVGDEEPVPVIDRDEAAAAG